MDEPTASTRLEPRHAAGSLLNPLLADPFLTPTEPRLSGWLAPSPRVGPSAPPSVDELPAVQATPIQVSEAPSRRVVLALPDFAETADAIALNLSSSFVVPAPRLPELLVNTAGTPRPSAPTPGGPSSGPFIGFQTGDNDAGDDSGDTPFGPTNNQAPEAVPDGPVVDEDGTLTFDTKANDTDPDGDPLTITAVGAAAHGTATLNANQTVTYVPVANYNGPDEFTYSLSDGYGGTATGTVYMTVAPVNDAPVAVADAATVAEDVDGVNIDVVANDTDIDGRMKVVTDYTQPAYGYAFDNGDGTIRYIPNGDFNGTDAFQYTVWDGDDESATGTVNVTVTPVADAPAAFHDFVGTSDVPLPGPQVMGNVLANDIDYDLGDANYDPATLVAIQQTVSFSFAAYTIYRWCPIGVVRRGR